MGCDVIEVAKEHTDMVEARAKQEGCSLHRGGSTEVTCKECIECMCMVQSNTCIHVRGGGGSCIGSKGETHLTLFFFGLGMSLAAAPSAK